MHFYPEFLVLQHASATVLFNKKPSHNDADADADDDDNYDVVAYGASCMFSKLKNEMILVGIFSFHIFLWVVLFSYVLYTLLTDFWRQ